MLQVCIPHSHCQISQLTSVDGRVCWGWQWYKSQGNGIDRLTDKVQHWLMSSTVGEVYNNNNNNRSWLTLRLPTALLWLQTHTLNWSKRGIEWKHSMDSSSDSFSTVPSTRTYNKHLQRMHYSSFENSSLADNNQLTYSVWYLEQIDISQAFLFGYCRNTSCKYLQNMTDYCLFIHFNYRYTCIYTMSQNDGDTKLVAVLLRLQPFYGSVDFVRDYPCETVTRKVKPGR